MTARWTIRIAMGVLPLFTVGLVNGSTVKLGSPFGSHMVLQRDRPLRIWGTGEAGAQVAVSVGPNHGTANVDGSGRWSATLAALPAGGPFTITAATGNATATAEDVLVGDVFLCSGQSNMQYGLGEVTDGGAIAAVPHPTLRLGKVASAWVKAPAATCDCTWQPATPASAKWFSAVAYCFAHQLYEQDPTLRDVPIGLLEDCLGATVIESWMPATALSGFERKSLQMSMFGIGPTTLYNGMIAPLKTLPMKGVIWYQGEGNSGRPARYAQYLPLMIGAWRAQLAQPELPFLIVQLPDYAPDSGGIYWQWIREAEAKAAAATPHVGYAVTINTNDGWNLHPQGKHEIGRRLAMLARQEVYGEPVPGRSPALESATVSGDAVTITFDTDGSTLTSGTSPVEGFAVAGADGDYHAATATITGADTVVVRSSAVPEPRTVRYAWAGVPRSTLASAAGLPAAPFRTDDQPVSKDHGEAQVAPAGFVFNGPNYKVAMDGNGRATSLVVRGQQLLSNADGQWGGAGVTRNLSKAAADGLGRVVFSGDGITETVAFADGGVRWTIANGTKDAITFRAALSPCVEVAKGGDTVTLHRGGATVEARGFDAVTTPTDSAADAGSRALDVSVPAGGTRTVQMAIGK